MTIRDLADALGISFEGTAEREVAGAASLENPNPDHEVYVEKPDALEKLQAACPQAIPLLASDLATTGGDHLRTQRGKYTFVDLLALFDPRPTPAPGIHPMAFVADTAQVAESASIGAFAVVEDGAVVGENTVVHPQVYIGHEAQIGEDTVLYPQVVINAFCQVGARCILHSGTVIGADGFGLIEAEEGHTKVPQIGRVIISDDVEIGANCTIDRGTIDDTLIERGVKFDNLSHIGHNCRVGEHSRIVAQVGISGSVDIGRHVIFAGQAGAADHVSIGDYAIIGGRGGVIRNIPAGKMLYSGMPAAPHAETVTQYKTLKALPGLVPEVMKLFERVTKLEKSLQQCQPPKE